MRTDDGVRTTDEPVVAWEGAMKAEPKGASWLVDDEEGMAGRISAYDWSATPIGDIEAWPPGLRIAVKLMLDNGFPMAIAWGRDATLLYNDGYAAVIGSHHPDVLGQSMHTLVPEGQDA
ncbi:MAG: hypothetical protein WKF63_10560, partial [Thermomicrobiales bacterium]